jgi:hypothetical protein
VLLVALLVAAAAVMIPLMRAQVGQEAPSSALRPEPPQIEEPAVRPGTAPPTVERGREIAIDESPLEALPPVEAAPPLPSREDVLTRVPMPPIREPGDSTPHAVIETPDPTNSDMGSEGNAAADDGIESATVAVRAARPEPEAVFVPVPVPGPGIGFDSEPEPEPEPEVAVEPDFEPVHGAISEQEPATEAEVARTPSPASGGLVEVSINATPWANIEVDGVDVGVTPIGAVPLRVGSHSFKARMPDGRVIERVVEISADERFVAFE